MAEHSDVMPAPAQFHRQSATFAAAWRASGGEAAAFEQPAKNHIDAIAGLEEPDSPLCRAIIDFMAAAERGRP